MGDYYIGEIRLFPYNNIPRDWHICDGTILPVQNNAALFSLIGNYFGGDGRNNFALPNLQGRVVVGSHDPSQHLPATVGGSFGSDLITLTDAQIPPHTHNLMGVAAQGSPTVGAKGAFIGEAASPSPVPPGAPAAPPLYQSSLTATGKVLLNGFSVGATGGGAGHENRQPYLALMYCISMSGVYPPRP
ncbi:phage tail protein [Niveispirillum sp.]|uniref:phage tail protein n=1 Tax=Niveispirillum sp. TaxID=1917217 RepID=UPI001B49A4B5|nr:tail fiber protein [Niveispirillum sp.]MBP7336173.1 tail fiber protein [Niveispirillum sp.]